MNGLSIKKKIEDKHVSSINKIDADETKLSRDAGSIKIDNSETVVERSAGSIKIDSSETVLERSAGSIKIDNSETAIERTAAAIKIDGSKTSVERATGSIEVKVGLSRPSNRSGGDNWLCRRNWQNPADCGFSKCWRRNLCQRGHEPTHCRGSGDLSAGSNRIDFSITKI